MIGIFLFRKHFKKACFELTTCPLTKVVKIYPYQCVLSAQDVKGVLVTVAPGAQKEEKIYNNNGPKNSFFGSFSFPWG